MKVERKETAKLFGEEFHTPSHIFLCIENVGGLQLKNGHLELSMALAKLVGIVPILVCQSPFYKTSSIQELLSWHILFLKYHNNVLWLFRGLIDDVY